MMPSERNESILVTAYALANWSYFDLLTISEVTKDKDFVFGLELFRPFNTVQHWHVMHLAGYGFQYFHLEF